jgi:hypothetical protein
MPAADRVAVFARAIDTNDDTEEDLNQEWEGPVAELDQALAAAVATIERWRTRNSGKEQPVAPSRGTLPQGQGA